MVLLIEVVTWVCKYRGESPISQNRLCHEVYHDRSQMTSQSLYSKVRQATTSAVGPESY